MERLKWVGRLCRLYRVCRLVFRVASVLLGLLCLPYRRDTFERDPAGEEKGMGRCRKCTTDGEARCPEHCKGIARRPAETSAERRTNVLKKRPEGVNLTTVRDASAPVSTMELTYPALWEFLHLTQWPDGGGERSPGSLLLFFQDGYLKCRLVDNDADEVAFWSGVDAADVLFKVEHDLASGGGDWRKQRPFPGKKK